jgi:hypothetical protein
MDTSGICFLNQIDLLLVFLFCVYLFRTSHLGFCSSTSLLHCCAETLDTEKPKEVLGKSLPKTFFDVAVLLEAEVYCAFFAQKSDEFPVRLCKKCFHDTHREAPKPEDDELGICQ